MGGAPCVLERFVTLACEVSVIVARDEHGEPWPWPVAENLHRDGILDVSIVPGARVRRTRRRRRWRSRPPIADKLDYSRRPLRRDVRRPPTGLLLVNEIAPRPHNSGHYTIDACVTSQFEQQARVLAGLPLGDTRQHEPAVMVNLLGDLWFAERDARAPREPDWSRVLRHPQAKLHLYGKAEPRRGARWATSTCLGRDARRRALGIARAIKRDLGIPGAELL